MELIIRSGGPGANAENILTPLQVELAKIATKDKINSYLLQKKYGWSRSTASKELHALSKKGYLQPKSKDGKCFYEPTQDTEKIADTHFVVTSLSRRIYAKDLGASSNISITVNNRGGGIVKVFSSAPHSFEAQLQSGMCLQLTVEAENLYLQAEKNIPVVMISSKDYIFETEAVEKRCPRCGYSPTEERSSFSTFCSGCGKINFSYSRI